MSCLKEKGERSRKFLGKSNNFYMGRDEHKDMVFAGTGEDLSMYVEFKLQ